MTKLIWSFFQKTVGLLLIICFGIAVILADYVNAAPYTHQQTGIAMPDSIDNLKLTAVVDYEKEDQGLGVGLSYRHQQRFIRADMYIYNRSIRNIPDGTPEIVKNELKNAVGDVYELQKRGIFKNISMVLQDEITAVGPKPFLHSLLTYSEGDAKWITQVYVSGYKNNFVKLRTTYLADKSAEGKRLTSKFLQAVGDGMAK